VQETGVRNAAFGADKFGFTGLNGVNWNLTEPKLYEHALINGEAQIVAGGALCAETGHHTGRSPKDKHTVEDDLTRDSVWWEGNRKMSKENFDNLLADVANKSMLRGYEEAEETFQKWTSKGTLPDFKAAKRVDLNTFPALAQVTEGAEYKYVTVGDRGETIQLATYGSLFSITRQAIINDDLDAFTRVPNKMGRAAIRTVGNLVYAVLTGNPAMSDGVALFHANHSNTSTGVLSTAAVDALATKLARQTDPSGNTLNIEMAYLIVPRTLRGLALQVANSEFEVGTTNKNNTVPNFVRGQFDVIADARLDSASTAAHYAAANPNTHDTIEVAYLDGNESPTLEQQGGWTVDGVDFKVRLDAGVKALDFRGLAYSTGA
jgi:hypothetical protein